MMGLDWWQQKASIANLDGKLNKRSVKIMRRQQRRTAKIVNREAVQNSNLDWMIFFNEELRRKVLVLQGEIDRMRQWRKNNETI
jgi:hypothetical protein